MRVGKDQGDECANEIEKQGQTQNGLHTEPNQTDHDKGLFEGESTINGQCVANNANHQGGNQQPEAFQGWLVKAGRQTDQTEAGKS